MTVAWITGASSGIGRALALRLAQDGMTIAASARSAAALAETVAAADGFGGRVLAFPLDVTDAAAVAGTVAAIEASLGGIDLAVLNAGTHQPMSLDDFRVATARLLMEVNYFGTIHCLAVAARNHKRSDAQSRAVFSAHSLRRKGSSDARCLRLSARCLRRARDRGFRRKIRETQGVAG